MNKGEIYILLNDFNTEEFIKGFIVDYIYYGRLLGLIGNDVSNQQLINKIKSTLECIEFFDEDHEINEKYGRDFKGVPINLKEDNQLLTLYVRKKLGKKSELYFYHELTHILHNYSKLGDFDSEKSGLITLNDTNDILNEALTQFIAEEIYNEKHGLKKEMKEYASEDLRMLSGINIYSDLDNYQHFDYLANKFFDFFNMDKYELSRMLFKCDNNLTASYFKEKYQDKGISSGIANNLENFLEEIYLVDKIMYIGSDDDKKMLSQNAEISIPYKNKIYKTNLKKELAIYEMLLDFFGEQKLNKNK